MCKAVIPIFSIPVHIYCCSCCHRENTYKDISVDLYQNCDNLSIEDVKNSCDSRDNKAIGNVAQELKYIEYQGLTLDQLKNLTCLSNCDNSKLEKLKKQIDFINVVIYPYYIDFLLRLTADKKNNKANTSFVVSFGGSGRAIHWPSAYNIRKVASKHSPLVIDDIALEKDPRYSFLPIFVDNTTLHRSKDNFKLFYPGVFIKDTEQKNKFIYCRMVLNYLMQLANPIFYICNHAIEDTASMYNVALMLKDIFNIDVNDFFYSAYSELDIASSAGFKSRETIKSLLCDVDGCFEEKVIMLAGVIALNNLLYKVYKVANCNNINLNCTLGFESYSGRVWEMLIAIWLNAYQNFPTRDDDNAKVTRDALQCVLTHCLIGNNKLFYNEASIGNRQQVLIKVSEILKGLANGEGLGEDRMDYLDCEKIFGTNIKDLVVYWKQLTDKPTIQVISQIVYNEGSGIGGFLKHLFHWRFDRLLSSSYESQYNDGMLSDQGLFIYHDDFKDYKTLPFIQPQNGGKYVKDDELNIVYIIADAGRHLDNKRWMPYDKQASRVYNIIDIVL